MNAHENPFRAGRLESLSYRFVDDDWPALLARLDRQRGRGAIVGQHGSGKTTLMLELAEHLAQRGLEVRVHRLNLQDRRIPAPVLQGLGPNQALLLDSAGCLSPWRWAQVMWQARRAGVFVVTSHRIGLLPTLCRCRTDPDLLEALVRELTGRTPGIEAATLWWRHRGNLREALRELYDRYAC